MAAQQKPEPEQPPPPATRMQLTPAERETIGVGKYPAHIQAAIDARKMASRVAAEIAAQSWGKEMSHEGRVALARWGQEYGVDVTTEIDVLGGKPYLNARFYFNRAAEMVRDGLIEGMVADFIHEDGRLETLVDSDDAAVAQQATAELNRRQMARIQFGVPDAAVAACVARVFVRRGGTVVEFTGCKYVVPGRKKVTKWGEKDADPVGDEFPLYTVETRAMRRALRLLVSHVPRMQRWIDAATDAGEVMAGELREIKGQAALREADVLRSLPAAAGKVSAPMPADPYAEEEADAARAADAVRLEDVEPAELTLPLGAQAGAPRPRGRDALREG